MGAVSLIKGDVLYPIAHCVTWEMCNANVKDMFMDHQIRRRVMICALSLRGINGDALYAYVVLFRFCLGV